MSNERLSVSIPGLRVSSGDNAHELWFNRHRKVKNERRLVQLALGAPRVWAFPLVITMTRIAPRELDTAGLASALKGTEDEIAKYLRIDDGRAERASRVIFVRNGRRRAPREYAVEIVIEPVPCPGDLSILAAAHPVLNALLGATGWKGYLGPSDAPSDEVDGGF